MPLFDRANYSTQDHLHHLFSNAKQVFISEGEYERIRCIERELWALKEAIADRPLKTVLISGTALETLLKLI